MRLGDEIDYIPRRKFSMQWQPLLAVGSNRTKPIMVCRVHFNSQPEPLVDKMCLRYLSMRINAYTYSQVAKRIGRFPAKRGPNAAYLRLLYGFKGWHTLHLYAASSSFCHLAVSISEACVLIQFTALTCINEPITTLNSRPGLANSCCMIYNSNY